MLTRSSEYITMPVMCPDGDQDNTCCITTYMASVMNMICDMEPGLTVIDVHEVKLRARSQRPQENTCRQKRPENK